MPPSNILFLAEGQLGDLLLLTPALHAVKNAFSSSRVSVLILSRHAVPTKDLAPGTLEPTLLGREANAVLASNRNVDALFQLDRQALRAFRGVRRIQAELAIIRWLRGQRFDAVVCTFPEDRFAEWAFLSGAGIRIGAEGQGLAWLLTQRIAVRKETVGVLEYYCALAESLGARTTSKQTRYAIPEFSKTAADEILRAKGIPDRARLIAIHPGASGDYKIWPPERFAELIERLRSEFLHTIVLFRGEQDEPIASSIRSLVKEPVIELDTSGHIGTFAALLSRCALCISNDSGPRHLAVAIAVPSLTIFRQHHDREWKAYSEGPRCITVQGSETCPACGGGTCNDKVPAGVKFGSYCMRMVNVEAVMREARRMLALP